MERVFGIEELASLLPGVTVLLGPPRTVDGSGTPYIKVALGGQVQCGELMASATNISDESLLFYFIAELKRAMGMKKYLVVRRLPTIAEAEVQQLEAFEHDTPRLITVTKRNITGRFTWYNYAEDAVLGAGVCS